VSHWWNRLSHRWNKLCRPWNTGPYSFLSYSYIYNSDCPFSRLTLISPNLTRSFTALILVLRGIPVTSVDSTISPPICSRLNASIRITRARCLRSRIAAAPQPTARAALPNAA
jgi:hypothetical protein